MRLLSLGAGVQSTTVLLLALDGAIPPVDAAIFADTGWEPRAVYAHLDRLQAHAEAHGLPVHRVGLGKSIRRVYEFGAGGGLDLPFFLTNERGERGMARRQCTSKFKVTPIRRKVRELMRDAGVKRAVQVFGISAEESSRMRDSDVKYLTHDYPLVGLGWRRDDCRRYLAESGWVAPRSACIGCPFHSNAEWRHLRDETPDEFADAVAFEKECQEHGLGVDATPYLHASRVPLDEVDLSTREDHGQMTFDDECAGVCGV